MGRPAINLVGQKFDRLFVLERDNSRPTGSGKGAYWICQCDCGNIKSVRGDKLRNKEVHSCGCLSKEIRTAMFLKDLTGERFGHLTVIERDMSKPKGKNKPAYWICLCDCGNITSVRRDHLEDGTTIGCGCNRGKSKGELRIKTILEEIGVSFQQEFIFKDLKGDSDFLRFDFAIFNQDKTFQCLIEYNGAQHYIPLYYDNEERFNQRLSYDEKKKEYCQQNNIKLVIIPYTDFDLIDVEYIKKRVGI